MTPTSRLASVLVALVCAACGGSSNSPTTPTSTSAPSGGSSSASSSAGSSHNAGTDCTRCHSFTVSGTVYRADGTTVHPGAVIRLTTVRGDTTTAVLTLTADRSGNFYTGSSVSFGQGLFATASGTTGAVASKTTAITSGACNRCHTAGQRIVVG